MLQTRTVDLSKFKNAVGFAATFSCKFGNTRKANIAKVDLQTDESQDNSTESARKEVKAKERLQLKKQLIVSKEYEAIKSYFGELRTWIYGQTVPSFFKEGFQLCTLAAVTTIEDRLKKAIRPSNNPDAPELPDLVEAFLKVYPRQIDEARAILEPIGQFNIADYPPAEFMRAAFSVTWNWIAFTVPESLPAELRAQETEKLERQLTDAGEQITLALRTGFSDLVTHLTERLTTQPGEKTKVFRDTAIGNILEFLDTFQNRNLMNDVQLADLVTRARQLLDGVTADKVRNLATVKDRTLAGFKEIQTALSGMITERASRVFEFEDDETSPAPTKSAAAAPDQAGQLALG